MLDAIRNRKDREQGFTLIELMVVVLIIAILVAIAVPTFLGARERAQDKAAQSDVRNGLVAAKVIFTDAEDYTDATEAELEAVEPSLDFTTDITLVSTSVVYVNAESATLLTMVRESAAGDFFCISDDSSPGGGTTYDSGAAPADVNTNATCNAASW